MYFITLDDRIFSKFYQKRDSGAELILLLCNILYAAFLTVNRLCDFYFEINQNEEKIITSSMANNLAKLC